MQLSSRSATNAGRALAWLLPMVALSAPAAAQLQTTFGTSAFREAGGPLSMTVLMPEVSADAQLTPGFAVNAAWTADIVSGASVAVVDAPAADVDAISSATVSDIRHELGGGLRIGDGQSTWSAGYRHGFENDYRSHAFDVSAQTELYERNTALQISYARSFDSICDGPDASEAVLKARLVSSDACFGGGDGDVDEQAEPRERDLSSQTFQAAWTQHWTGAITTQLTATAQLLDGFQANPYREVRIGRASAQEHHPDQRARYAAGLGARIWIAPLSGALQPLLRAYRDTWDVRSLSAELGYEQTIGAGLRVRGRGRYYVQSAAAFYSDDYVLAPRGRYFTGDRELSPMRSALLGAQVSWALPSDAEGRVLGFLSGLELALKGDLLKSWFDDFRYDRVEVPNDTALLGSLSLSAGF
jgi:hypothetical protein